MNEDSESTLLIAFLHSSFVYRLTAETKSLVNVEKHSHLYSR